MGLYKTWLLVGISLLSTAGMALENYRATYSISVRGVHAGEVMHEAIFTDLTYRVDTFASPSFAAKMLGFGRITELSQGLIKNGIVYPQKYQRSMEGDEEYRLFYDYQPDQHQVSAQIGNEQQVLDYDEGIRPLDILALIVQSSLDEEHQHIANDYTLLSENKIRTYSVEVRPNEVWQMPNGENVDIHVYDQINNNRQTRVYFAQNPVRLVKLTQYKDGDVRFNLKLIDYQPL